MVFIDRGRSNGRNGLDLAAMFHRSTAGFKHGHDPQAALTVRQRRAPGPHAFEKRRAFGLPPLTPPPPVCLARGLWYFWGALRQCTAAGQKGKPSHYGPARVLETLH